VRFGQEVAERGKNQASVPELDEKAKSSGKSKGGRRVWNGQKKGLQQHLPVSIEEEDDLPQDTMAPTNPTAPSIPERKGRFERMAGFAFHQKPKEKTRGGSKKDKPCANN
jgi:hypothetical protein